MDYTQTLTAVDRLLEEVQKNTAKVKAIHIDFKLKCEEMDDEGNKILKKVEHELEVMGLAKYFCGLPIPEQREFLDRYNNKGNGNGKHTKE